MLTYEYYCKAFPMRNQVYDFLEVLVTRDLALFKEGRNHGSLLESYNQCLQTGGNSEGA